MSPCEPSGIKRRTLLTSAAAVGAAGLAGMHVRPAAAAEPAANARPGSAAARAVRQPIRLPTGDLVVMQGSQIVDVQPVDPRTAGPILRYAVGGDRYVVPANVLGRIRAGELDERLFNVTGLARAGYQDAATADPNRISSSPLRRGRLPAEAGTHQVTVRLWDRLGKNPPDNEGWNRAYFLNADTGELNVSAADGEQVALPAGRYLVVAVILTPEPDSDFPSRSLIALPGLRVSADTEVALDARIGNRVDVTVPDRDAQTVLGLIGASTRVPMPKGEEDYYPLDLLLSLHRFDDVYVGSPAGAGDPDFLFIHRQMLQEPELQVTVTAPERFELKAERYDVLGPQLTGTHRLVAVFAGAATAEELAGLDLGGRLVLLDLPPEDGGEFDQRLRQVAGAGALAALHVGETPPSPRSYPLPLPAGYALGAGAQRLAELTVGETVDVTWRGLTGSPYRYDLSFPAREAIPTQQRHRLRRRDLAHLSVTYASQGAPDLGRTGAAAFFYGFGLGAGGGVLVPRPMVRDEYVTPGEWELNSTSLRVMLEQSWQVRHTYQAGHHYVVEWHKAVLGPAFPPGSADRLHQVVRDQDTISCGQLMVTDGQQNPGELWFPGKTDDYTITGSQELYLDGRLLGRVDEDGLATFDVPPEPGRYELRAELARDSVWWLTAPAVSAAWTFESSHTEAETFLPLLTVQATADVDETNTAPGNRALLLPIRVHRQGLDRPAPVRTIGVHYSLQDGEDWQAARVVTSGPSEWTARIAKPGRGFLSLRFSVSDRDGNTVRQTVLRAIRLR